jgi:hypothetical protein
MNISYNTEDELNEILERVPFNQNIIITVGTRRYPKGRLWGRHLKRHNKHTASVFWTDGLTCEYLWFHPEFQKGEYKIKHIEVI